MNNEFYGTIAKIEKLVSEYRVSNYGVGPYDAFKVRIFYDGEYYESRTNIQIIDEIGNYYGALGSGKTEEEALEDTIHQFFEMTSWKDEWNDEDFDWADPDDF